MLAWKNNWKYVKFTMDGDAACLDDIHMKEGRKDGDDRELTRIMLQESFHSLLNLLKEVLCCLQ